MLDEAVRLLASGLGEPEGPPVPLEGGITNRNYRLRWAGRDCVLRLPGKDTELLGIDREAERAATEAAAALGIGPEVVAFEPALGCLVTRFIEGRPVGEEELRARVPEVAAALRAIHAGPALAHRFSPLARAERYREEVLARGGEIPAGYDDAHAAAVRIRSALAGAEHAPVPCHNDLLAANFLDDGARLRLLDWEYAGMGDRYFDLANFASNNRLDDAGVQALLESYWGEPATPARLAAVGLMRLLAAFWEAMWAVVQATVSELDVDRAYAGEHLERMRGSLADPRFEGWLEDARGG
jgi:thiamine kinase-like enzyme